MPDNAVRRVGPPATTQGAPRRVATSILVVLVAAVVWAVAFTAPAGAAVPRLKWSPPESVDPGGSFAEVSCATAHFCVVFDGSGNVFAYDGASWSSATSVDPGGGDVASYSCPTSSFCIAVDSRGDVLSYDGSRWSAPRRIARGVTNLTSVSCPSVRFCVAVADSGEALTYDGSKWSAPTDLASVDPNSLGLAAVSCGSTSSCVAVDVSGEILSFDGSRWSDMSSTDFVAGGSISCPSAEFCALADGQGHVLTYDGSKWSAPVDVRPDTNDTDNTVSCASEKFCVFVDGDGYASVYDGSHWSRATNVDPEIAQSASGNPIGGEGLGVSCTSATFCAAVDGTGAALTYSNGSHGTSTTAPGAAPSGTIRASGAIRGDWKLTRAAQCTVHAAKAGADVELVTGGHGPTLTINVLKKGATATAVGLRGTRDFLGAQ
ncbi:MAG: hypothetical protein ACRDXC_04895 [Acidimicrobiales bacterium]